LEWQKKKKEEVKEKKDKKKEEKKKNNRDKGSGRRVGDLGWQIRGSEI